MSDTSDYQLFVNGKEQICVMQVCIFISCFAFLNALKCFLSECARGPQRPTHQRVHLLRVLAVQDQPGPVPVRPLQGRVSLHLHQRRIPRSCRLQTFRFIQRQERQLSRGYYDPEPFGEE